MVTHSEDVPMCWLQVRGISNFYLRQWKCYILFQFYSGWSRTGGILFILGFWAGDKIYQQVSASIRSDHRISERCWTSYSSWLSPGWPVLDHNDGQFFRAMEWLMFFLGHHCRQWFFNGFDKVGPSPLNVFWGVQPLEPMVFRWFSKFWGQWSTMVLRLTMESLVKIISPNDDNIISRYFKELWKIR